MRRILPLFIFLAIFTGIFYAIKDYVFYDISLEGIVPAFKPPGSNIKNFLPQSSQTTGPLHLSGGFTVDIYADVKANLPTEIEFDPGGNLVFASTKKGKVFALPDRNGDGYADEKVEILSGLNNPLGIAFDSGMIYVAESDRVSRYPYSSKNNTAGFEEPLLSLPPGGVDKGRGLKIKDGKLYISLPASCNVCTEEDSKRGTILVSDLDGGNLKVFAKGLRDTLYFDFDKEGNMWGNERGRTGLGDDLPPDELNLIKKGKDYGWPWCYGDRIRDSEFRASENSSYCTETEPPVYKYKAHANPLGITIADSRLFPSETGDLFVAFHGSGKASNPVGYRVSRLSLFGGTVSFQDIFIYGWFRDGNLFGRPVDVEFGPSGKIFISDDNTGLIYIVSRN